MKNAFWLLVMLVPCSCFGALDNPCTTARVLTKVRPGAAWTMQGDSMKTLKWLDGSQSKPSAAEVEKVKKACIEDTKSRDALKAQARLDVKNSSTPVEKKVEALIVLLDMDK